jgi:hypothetical protein
MQLDLGHHVGMLCQQKGDVKISAASRIKKMHPAIRRPPFTERGLRPIATITDYHDQNQEFQKLLG